MDIKIRQIRPNSRQEIDVFREFYRKSFETEFPEDVWRWKYMENPLNPGDPLIFIAEANNRIVGFSALLPSKAILNVLGKISTLSICQTANSMVHPEFRRKGIYEELMKYSIEVSRAKCFQLKYSFSNDLSVNAELKTGSAVIGRLNRYQEILNWENSEIENYLSKKQIPDFSKKLIVPFGRYTLNLFHPPNVKSDYAIKKGPVFDFAPDIEKLNAEHLPVDAIYGYRGLDFLRWRYRRPDRYYLTFCLFDGNDLVAYLIVSIPRGSKIVVVKDLFAKTHDKNAVKTLIWQAFWHFKQRSFKSFSIDMLDRKWPYENIFSCRHGFRRVIAEHLCILTMDESLDNEFVSNKNNWLFQPIDRSPF